MTFPKTKDCECKKEKLWHVYSDFHRRTGKDVAKRARIAINKILLHGYIIIDRFSNIFNNFKYPFEWTSEMLINHFAGILNSFEMLGIKFPKSVFMISDYEDSDDEKEIFYDENDNEIHIHSKPQPQQKKPEQPNRLWSDVVRNKKF
jgi:hypothetical protein